MTCLMKSALSWLWISTRWAPSLAHSTAESTQSYLEGESDYHYVIAWS